jgi:3-hydroxyacyl-[acyl-carrier-protein] dehydratase
MARPDTLIDPADYPLDNILFDAEECMRRNPQRFEFLQLTSILHMDLENNLIVGHRHIGDDEFWMRGHLPGRPLFPGVLMIECMAQIASIHAHHELKLDADVFMGFGAVDGVRFRKPVEPNTDLIVAGKIVKASPRIPYFKWEGQMMTADGEPVCQATITGAAF